MPKPYRDDQRRLMVTLSADRYNELKKTARAYSLSMTGIINNLIGDYLRAEREGGFDLTGAALADRVEILEKRFATLSAILTDKRGRKRQSVKHSETDLTPPTDNAPTFGSVPHDHGNGAPKTSTENKSDNGPKASTVDASRLFAAIDPAPIRATTAEIKSTSTGNDAATSRPETTPRQVDRNRARRSWRRNRRRARRWNLDAPTLTPAPRQSRRPRPRASRLLLPLLGSRRPERNAVTSTDAPIMQTTTGGAFGKERR